MWNKFLRNPLHIVKDYELRKLLWQSGGGTEVCKKYLKFRDKPSQRDTSGTECASCASYQRKRR